jgi:asparagine synthase (glutamine-hydrolysing)
MCGLVAILQRAGTPDARVLEAMADAIAHRGPDGAGRHLQPGVGLAHRRLAIIDPEGGAQPMHAAGVTLVFNGAIVNHVELRDELVALGHVFVSRCDTEVLLHAYLQWGEAAVERLVGMFAFVLHDARRRGCLAARDHFGVKPLYWRREADRILFASEIKGLLAAPGTPRALDAQALDDYLALQVVLGGRTLFEGVHALEPAHLQWIDLQTLETRTRRYWRRRFDAPAPADPEALRGLVAASVERQLRSDVPLGLYLSGGLDSSLVAAAAARVHDGPLHAFTGAFREGPEFDETAHARTVATHVGARLETLWPTEDDWIEQMPRLARQMDEPAAGPGLFPQFMVSRLARRSVKVCLGGQGGDELFGGYARHLIGALESALDDAIAGRSDPLRPTLAQLEPGLATLGPYRPLLRSAWRNGLEAPAWQRYFRLIDRSGTDTAWLAAAHRDPARRAAVAQRVEAIFEAPRDAGPVQRMLEFDLTTTLPGLLQVEDRVSMAVGLESRVPLLDPALAEAAARLPDAALLAGGRLKAVLREVAEPWLPASIVHRTDKMGFPVPLQQWSRGRARDFVADVLGSRACRERGLFEPDALTRLIDGEQPFGRAMWGALQLELWHLTMIDAPAGGHALAA